MIQDIIKGKDEMMQEKDDIIQERAQLIQSLQQTIALQNIALQNNRLQENEQQLTETIRGKDDIIRRKEQRISESQQECQQLRETIRDKDRELQQLTSEQVTQELEKQQPKTKPLLAKPQTSHNDLNTHHSDNKKETRERFELKWEKGNKAPLETNRGPDAVVDGDMVYIRPYASQTIFAYNSTDETWNQLPKYPTSYCSLAVVDHLLTTIGGRNSHDILTNQLFSLTGEGSNKTWSEVFPPMPTERDYSMAVCNRQALIVAGGVDQNFKKLRTVEVMDITTKQWSTAAHLPGLRTSASATICGDRIYMLGGWSDNRATNSVYTCSLAGLFRSCRSRSRGSHGKHLVRSLSLTVWNKVADLPVTQSTCVTLHGRLLATGGVNSNNEPTSDIYIYDATSNQWEIISKMTVARYLCFAAVLPNSKLMVAGGYTGQNASINTDSVEIATII